MSSWLQTGIFAVPEVNAAWDQKRNIALALVDSAIYDGISWDLDRYANTYIPRQSPGTDLLVLPVDPDWFTPVDIQHIISNLYFDGHQDDPSSLVWVILFGDIPLPSIEINDELYQSLFPYTDLAGPPMFEYDPWMWYRVSGETAYSQPELRHAMVPGRDQALFTKFFEKLKQYYADPMWYAEPRVRYDDFQMMQDSFSPEQVDTYINTLLFAEDRSYNRFNKPFTDILNAEYTDDVLETIGEASSTLVQSAIVPGDEYDHPEVNAATTTIESWLNSIMSFFDEDEVVDAVTSASDNPVPTLINAKQTENNFRDIFSIYGDEYLSAMEANLTAWGRYDIAKIDNSLDFIQLKDNVSISYLKDMNIMMEQALDAQIQKEQYMLKYPLPVFYEKRWTLWNDICVAPSAFLNNIDPWWVPEILSDVIPLVKERYENFYFGRYAWDVQEYNELSVFRWSYNNLENSAQVLSSTIDAREMDDIAYVPDQFAMWASYGQFAQQTLEMRWYDMNLTSTDLELREETKCDDDQSPEWRAMQYRWWPSPINIDGEALGEDPNNLEFNSLARRSMWHPTTNRALWWPQHSTAGAILNTQIQTESALWLDAQFLFPEVIRTDYANIGWNFFVWGRRLDSYNELRKEMYCEDRILKDDYPQYSPYEEIEFFRVWEEESWSLLNKTTLHVSQNPNEHGWWVDRFLASPDMNLGLDNGWLKEMWWEPWLSDEWEPELPVVNIKDVMPLVNENFKSAVSSIAINHIVDWAKDYIRKLPWIDQDVDGRHGWLDLDIDGSSIENIDDIDVDGDSVPNNTDTDIDNDGIPNAQDLDMDGDRIPNAADIDQDADWLVGNQDLESGGCVWDSCLWTSATVVWTSPYIYWMPYNTDTRWLGCGWETFRERDIYDYHIIDTVVQHKAPTNTELAEKHILTMERAIDDPRYTTFHGLWWDLVKFVYPDMYQVKVYEWWELLTEDEIASSIRAYLIEKANSYNQKLSNQLVLAPSLYNQTPEAYDFLSTVHVSASPNRSYELIPDDFFLELLGEEWVLRLANSLYYLSYPREERPSWENFQDFLESARNWFSLDRKLEYISEQYLLTDEDLPSNDPIRLPRYIDPEQEKGYELVYINSDRDDAQPWWDDIYYPSTFENISLDPDENVPNTYTTQARLEDESIDNECNIPPEWCVPLLQRPKALKCWLNYTAQNKIVDFELEISIDFNNDQLEWLFNERVSQQWGNQWDTVGYFQDYDRLLSSSLIPSAWSSSIFWWNVYAQASNIDERTLDFATLVSWSAWSTISLWDETSDLPQIKVQSDRDLWVLDVWLNLISSPDGYDVSSWNIVVAGKSLTWPILFSDDLSKDLLLPISVWWSIAWSYVFQVSICTWSVCVIDQLTLYVSWSRIEKVILTPMSSQMLNGSIVPVILTAFDSFWNEINVSDRELTLLSNWGLIRSEYWENTELDISLWNKNIVWIVPNKNTAEVVLQVDDWWAILSEVSIDVLVSTPEIFYQDAFLLPHKNIWFYNQDWTLNITTSWFFDIKTFDANTWFVLPYKIRCTVLILKPCSMNSWWTSWGFWILNNFSMTGRAYYEIFCITKLSWWVALLISIRYSALRRNWVYDRSER